MKAVSSKPPSNKNLSSLAELRRRYALVIQSGDDRPQMNRHHPASTSKSLGNHSPHHGSGEKREELLGHIRGSQHFGACFVADKASFLPSDCPTVGSTPRDTFGGAAETGGNLFRIPPTESTQASHTDPRHCPLAARTAAPGMCAATAAGTWPPPALESLR